MADIFVSYKREDRARASLVVSTLEAAGYSVWWDNDIAAGERWYQTLENELHAAKAVLVLWSRHAVASRYVLDEAGYALDQGKLVAAMLDDGQPPIGFRSVQSPPLADWNGDAEHESWLRVREGLEGLAPSPELLQKAAAERAEVERKEAELAALRREIERLSAANASTGAKHDPRLHRIQAELVAARDELERLRRRPKLAVPIPEFYTAPPLPFRIVILSRFLPQFAFDLAAFTAALVVCAGVAASWGWPAPLVERLQASAWLQQATQYIGLYVPNLAAAPPLLSLSVIAGLSFWSWAIAGGVRRYGAVVPVTSLFSPQLLAYVLFVHACLLGVGWLFEWLLGLGAAHAIVQWVALGLAVASGLVWWFWYTAVCRSSSALVDVLRRRGRLRRASVYVLSLLTPRARGAAVAAAAMILILILAVDAGELRVWQAVTVAVLLSGWWLQGTVGLAVALPSASRAGVRDPFYAPIEFWGELARVLGAVGVLIWGAVTASPSLLLLAGATILSIVALRFIPRLAIVEGRSYQGWGRAAAIVLVSANPGRRFR